MFFFWYSFHTTGISTHHEPTKKSWHLTFLYNYIYHHLTPKKLSDVMILTNGDFNHQVQVSACAQAGVIGDQSRAPGASWVFPNSMSTLEKRSIHIPEKT